jgi:hypothetical protein
MADLYIDVGDKDLPNFFSRHLIVISWWHESDQKPESASSFLVRHRGRLILITAGHVIKDLRAAEKKRPGELIVKLFDGLSPSSEHKAGFAIPFKTLGRSRIGDGVNKKMRLLDFGYIVLNEMSEAFLSKNHCVPMEESGWRGVPERIVNRAFVVGVPGESIGYTGPHINKMASLMLPFNIVRSPLGDDDDTGRLYGKVELVDGITSVAGMSGGPIFVTELVGGRERYWFYGLQSGWFPESKIITINPIAGFADLLAQSIEQAIEMEKTK